MITFNMLLGIAITCLFTGTFFGFFLFAMVSINKRTDEKLQAQTDEALYGAPRFDRRARKEG